MNNNGKKKSGGAWIWVIIVLLCAATGAADGSVACLVIIGAVAVITIVRLAERSKKNAAGNPAANKIGGSPQAAANRPVANPYGAAKKPTANPDAAARRMAAHEVSTPRHPHEDAEGAPIRCTCSRGKQRYLDQAAMFYKNGLIDKAEYKFMCERYNKLDIPEDF